MCFLATYCKQYWKAGLSAFINYNSSRNMEFWMKIEGTKWFFWQCANLIINSLKLLVSPKCSLHLSFWTNQRANGLFLPWFYWILRIQKNHSFFFISPPKFFVLYLFTRYEGQKPKPSLPWICLWGRPATSRISGHVIIFCTKESSSSSKPGPNIAKRGSAWVTSDCKKEVTAPYRGRLDFKLLLPWGQLLLYLCKIDATRN